MASSAPLGCAQNADGSLKDPSEIKWYEDKDDDIPMDAAPQASSSSSSGRPPSSPTRHASPAEKIAGVRRSGRPAIPSRRVLESRATEDSGSDASGSRKRKSTTRKVVLSDDEDVEVPAVQKRRRVQQKSVPLFDGEDNSDPDFVVDESPQADDIQALPIDNEDGATSEGDFSSKSIADGDEVRILSTLTNAPGLIVVSNRRP